MVWAVFYEQARTADRRVKQPRHVDEFVEWAWADDDPNSELWEAEQERARALLDEIGGDL